MNLHLYYLERTSPMKTATNVSMAARRHLRLHLYDHYRVTGVRKVGEDGLQS
jgi:hypothetical protein